MVVGRAQGQWSMGGGGHEIEARVQGHGRVRWRGVSRMGVEGSGAWAEGMGELRKYN